MQGNTNFESKSVTRKERNARPPRGEQQERPQQAKRGKQWDRVDTKRQWDNFGMGGM